MKKTIHRLAVFLFAASIFFSCSNYKIKNRPSPVAVKKIMTVEEATTFLKANTENEGREIIVRAFSRGLPISSPNSTSLSLVDDSFGEPQSYLNEFYACFGKEATEYAIAVPKDATVTISGKIRYANGKARLENCKLIAQN